MAGFRDYNRKPYSKRLCLHEWWAFVSKTDDKAPWPPGLVFLPAVNRTRYPNLYYLPSPGELVCRCMCVCVFALVTNIEIRWINSDGRIGHRSGVRKLCPVGREVFGRRSRFAFNCYSQTICIYLYANDSETFIVMRRYNIYYNNYYYYQATIRPLLITYIIIRIHITHARTHAQVSTTDLGVYTRRGIRLYYYYYVYHYINAKGVVSSVHIGYSAIETSNRG